MLLLLFACRSSITVGGDGASGLDSGAAEIPPNAVIASPAFDPLSGATWTWTTSEPVEGPARVESEDG